MDVEALLTGLRDAASSPLALAAYVIVVAAWSAGLWFASQPQRQIDAIQEAYLDDANRLEALRTVLGSEVPVGTPKAHIIKIIQERGKQKARSLLLVAYLATILAIIVITAMAVYRASEGKIPPKLVGSSVERHRP